MSKEKLLLVGAGGFGRMVAEQAMLQYDCAFVDDGQPVGAEICGIPVVGGLADLPKLRKEYDFLVVGIGNNQFRAQVYEKAKVLDFVFPNIVAPSAYISPFAAVGEYALIYTNSVIRTGATVGNFARIGSNCTICNHATVPDGTDIPDCTAVH